MSSSNWNTDKPKPSPQERTPADKALTALGGLIVVVTLTSLAAAPAILIGLWKWALG